MTDRNRRDQLKALFGTVEPAAPNAETASSQSAAPAEIAKPRSASGAVKAMGLSLGGISREIEDARRLKDSLAGAERIVELDPNLIDTSFVEDRLSPTSGFDENFEALVESISQNGQQVPILVRPHPENPGRYQTAYGHRRLRAALRIGKPVQAIIRELSDTQLVLAQGKENTERRDLSFIERAFFARNLIERGFERGLVQDALSLDKAEMTRYLQVAAAVPFTIIRAIGPAPKVGRPRWVRLAELFKAADAQALAHDEISRGPFQAADSNARFNLVFARLLKRIEPVKLPARPASAHAAAQPQAGKVARLDIEKGRHVLTFSEQLPEGFAEYVAAELEGLLARYRDRKTG